MNPIDVGIDMRGIAIHSAVDDNIVDKFTAARVRLAATAG